jgi:hypothetical protein
MTEKERIERRRLELRKEFGALYDTVTAILFEVDPIGINFETNTDEYEPETRTILPRLASCETVDKLRAVVHEEFTHWFGPDTAGTPEKYTRVAHEIWAAAERRSRR